MDALAIIFSFVGVVVGSVLTYLFTKSHYEQKRKDELADREFARRATIHDLKIKEVRDYADTLSEIFNSTANLISELLRLEPRDLTRANIDWVQEQAGYLADLDDKVKKQILSLFVFEDARLNFVNDELVSIRAKYHNYLIKTTDAILRGKRAKVDMKKLKEARNRYIDGQVWVMELKTRIDELAQTVE